jgi:hypothetical protein
MTTFLYFIIIAAEISPFLSMTTATLLSCAFRNSSVVHPVTTDHPAQEKKRRQQCGVENIQTIYLRTKLTQLFTEVQMEDGIYMEEAFFCYARLLRNLI